LNTIQRVTYHYIRLKVFNEKGKEAVSTIQIDNDGQSAIIQVAARTLKPDGTIVELDNAAIFTRDSARMKGANYKTTSFAVPGLEPGAIVEYRWKEVLDSAGIRYIRLQFQREFPVRSVSYFVKPLETTTETLRLQGFNCKPTPMKYITDFLDEGYNMTTVENIPAYHEEPFQPSQPNLRQWALLFYQAENVKDPDRYWSDAGKKAYDELKRAAKTSDEVKAATTKAIGQAATDQDKIVNITRYIQTNFRNIANQSVTDTERQKYFQSLPKERMRTSVEVLKSGLGSAYELNVLFAAMAMQAGLDARPVQTADWNDVAFNPKVMTNGYYIDNIHMGVKIGESWKIYDASTKLLKPGMLPWRHEGVYALLSDPKKPEFLQTDQAKAKDSVEGKTAKFELSADGTLEGDVEESLTGHRAYDRRLELEGESQERQEQWLRDRILAVFPNAEITNLAIDAAEDGTLPLTFRYHVKAPRFAQLAGTRMFFNVLPFERGKVSPFSASERRNPVRFPYAWTETDNITIKPPAGFEFDNPTSPGSIAFGQAGGYVFKLSSDPDTREVSMVRELTFSAVYFETKDYPILKQVFSEIQKRDTHTLALVRSR
jgi:hypothetical protein